MVACLVVMVGLAGLLSAVALTSIIEIRETRLHADTVRAGYVAQAGSERAINFLNEVSKAGAPTDPLSTVRALFNAGDTNTVFSAEPLTAGGTQVGAYTVRLVRLAETATSMTIAIDSSGYMPAAPDPANGAVPSAWSAWRTTVRLSMGPSKVFNYAYFINNWGWFYGHTIFSMGNARSNGQFDATGYAPTITGQPMYEQVEHDGVSVNLTGYADDNGDGLTDGNDGGVYAGWDIVNVNNVKGNGGKASNQHDFDGHIDMPNLSDLTQYESLALSEGSTIKISGVTYASGVVGDEPSEKENLFLVGTAANPIVLDGPVVVRGDVIIKGPVTGQGAIYAGGNIYCPDSITYVNGPTTPRPADNTESATEAWLQTNWNKDFLGLFARENVVVGDHTHWIWQHYVGWWMGHSMNASAEDAGADGIPNTKAGLDGISGTADDDVLEGDGAFTVDYYTEVDELAGLIPAGFDVGDAVPGSGEDIDGDGHYDDGATLSDVVLSKPLNTGHWRGNMPPGGYGSFKDISSLYANRLDATIYTNHSFCWTVLGSNPASINGALVCRNENIVYGTPSVTMNHDPRLLGNAAGKASMLLPRVLQPIEVLRFSPLDNDPNRYQVSP
jgi:hypothetical protein